MKYFLLKSASRVLSDIDWLDGEREATPPEYCDLIKVTAYGADEQPLTGASYYLTSTADNTLPDELIERVIAECEAGEPLVLPDDIASISPILSGMV